MKHHFDNLEGAFPLLLIGSVLVVYAGILASQQIGSHTSQLPLWGLLGGIGAVIVGAGIYSTFLEPEASPVPKTAEPWVTVSRAEWEARTGSRKPREQGPTPSEPAPIWWEGPAPAGTTAPPSRVPPPPSASRTARVSSPKAAPPVERRPPRPARAVPRPSARYSFRELSDELSELEALVYGSSVVSARKLPSAPAAGAHLTTTCMDCDRPLTAAASPSPCRSCGRGLCASCAASSKSEDGEVRCVDCRARES